MSKKEKALYFIALVPPPAIYDEVNDLKKSFSINYHSKASLKSPPHITLHMPFTWSESRVDEIYRALYEIRLSNPIKVSHDGFGSFPPRVIYLNVNLSEELKQLQKSISIKIREKLKVVKDDYRNKGFHPHMTIAFRDLRPAQYQLAWSEFESKQIQLSWEANSFYLLKHSGVEWGLSKEFSFC